MSSAAAVSPELFREFDEIADLIRGFESGTLPRAEWTHRAHLTVACWYLLCSKEPEATDKIRRGIQAYNKAQGIVTTASSGYHETMTLFWIRIVRHELSKLTLERSLVCLLNEMGLHFADARLPFRYYSYERLMSPEARRVWTEPDLEALP